MAAPLLRLKTALLRWWASLNYRYCCSNAYLATHRHEILIAVDWSQRANDWQEEWRGTCRELEVRP